MIICFNLHCHMHGVPLVVLVYKTSKDSTMKCVKVASALSEPIGKMQGFM